MKTKLNTWFFLFICLVSYSQQDYSILSIPSELKDQANAVVRFEKTDITVKSIDDWVISKELIVTVLNENGEKYAEPYEYYDKSNRIKQQEVTIYNKFGKKIKEISRSKFIDASAISSGDLYTDNRIKYFSYTPTEYPYTIHYKAELHYNETAFLQPWTPLMGTYLSVEKSEYSLVNLSNIPLKHKELNFDGYDIKNNSISNTLSYELIGANAIPREELAPAIVKIVPLLYVAMEEFSLVSVRGTASSWQAFGKWQYENLLKGLDEIPSETIKEVSALVAEAKSEREKVKLIYEFMQNRTRYISVQLGIGGWKPYPAEEVDALGYGDCKGLTNYTKALLKSQGIDSYYSIVYAGSEKRNIDKDFPSMQGNHIILNVPLEDEEIWLECTSQTMPFNFLGDFTDDRDVLTITNEGGVIKHTAIYDYNDNLQTSKGKIEILEDGSIKGNVQFTATGNQYELKKNLQGKDDEDMRIHYRELWGDLKRLEFKQVVVENDKNAIAVNEMVEISAKKYVDMINGKYIFKANSFNANNYLPKKYTKRRTPFQMRRGYTDMDENIITVPVGFEAEFIPEPIKIDSKFGSYSASVAANDDGSFTYNRKLVIKEGHFSSEEYKEYRKFRRTIRKHDNVKLVFIKL